RNFLKAGELTLASYDWTDIASGTGYSTYYGIDLEDASTVLIESSILDSLTGSTNYAFPDAMALRGEFNFDVTFNLPRYVKGELLVSETYYAY
ncbi:unnamed protein product, partial [marine sediment metagenome]